MCSEWYLKLICSCWCFFIFYGILMLMLLSIIFYGVFIRILKVVDIEGRKKCFFVFLILKMIVIFLECIDLGVVYLGIERGC